MSDVIGFADFIENRALRASRSFSVLQTHQQTAFTLRDRADLDDWSSADIRISICSSDTGPFAMLYRAGQSWASWGVVRQGRSVLLWDCITLADIGRFPSMIDALAAVPVADFPTPAPNVFHLPAARARTAPLGRLE